MIKHIKITDFKSIRQLSLALDPVTVIIGRSGTGKSNFVQAIRFLRNYLLNPEQAPNFEWGWERIDPAGGKDPKTSIEISFSVPGSEDLYDYALNLGAIPTRGNRGPISETLRVGDEVIFSRSFRKGPTPHGQQWSWQWDKKPNVANLSQYQDDKPMLGKFPSLMPAVDAYAALSSGIGYYHFPTTALALERQAHPYTEFLKNVPGLIDDAGNYRDILRRITQDFHRPDVRKNLLAALQRVNPSVGSVQLDSLTNTSRTIVSHKVGGQFIELPLEAESDGFRRFYAHLLALYQTPQKLTLIFEEPENAIFPGALSLLADEFKAAPRDGRGQVIITTHSPMLLDSFDVENVRVVEMHDGKTVIGRVSDEQRAAVKNRLLTTGELLTVDQAKLENAAAA
jgi:hypothetical protein